MFMYEMHIENESLYVEAGKQKYSYKYDSDQSRNDSD